MSDPGGRWFVSWMVEEVTRTADASAPHPIVAVALGPSVFITDSGGSAVAPYRARVFWDGPNGES